MAASAVGVFNRLNKSRAENSGNWTPPPNCEILQPRLGIVWKHCAATEKDSTV
jgi:hypothetical protein